MGRRLVALRKALLFSCATIVLSGGTAQVYGQQSKNDTIKTYNIQEERLGEALRQFINVSGRNILFAPELVRGRTTHGVTGAFSDEQALEMLLNGSGLEFDQTTAGTLVLRKAGWLIKAADAAAPASAAPRPAAPAQTAGSATPANVEEVVVTGSRIVREGYEAPTPLTVVSTEQLEKSADGSVVNFLASMPAVASSILSGNSTGINGNGALGIQSLNLRALGANRVLVLLDGQRVAPSLYEGLVDVSSFPSQLISRVDVVTGGASAVYGSDAVAGVVNFVLDRKYVGVKGEISGGVTNYGDGKNYKINLTTGFGFADDRGHVLLSGEHMFNAGIKGDGGRAWNGHGWLQLTNPAYGTGAGQSTSVPQLLLLPKSSPATQSPGGLVVAGPLKGTAFGAGGTPYKFNYGSIVSGDLMSGGGDWQSNMIQRRGDMDPVQRADRMFLRLSYDVTENINVFAQYSYSQNGTREVLFADWLAGTATTYLIKNDNAFLPASVKAAMAANNVTQIPIGSWNADMPGIGTWINRVANRATAGFEGNFDAFQSNWKWNAYYAYGSTKIGIHENSPVRANYTLAIDAVVNPATGQIVCRSTLTNPTNGCFPWNAMGIGVNTGRAQAFDFIVGGVGYAHNLIEQSAMGASVTGEPFSIWAGPVSLALSVEHRTDTDNGESDPFSKASARLVGNYSTLHGSQSVTEGAVETIIPLAKDESWAKAWDLSLAARFTGYQYAGYVTTWKVGTTYTPIDDVKFRLTRSRDIRAPNILDLFATAATNSGPGPRDPFLNNTTAPSVATLRSGNPDLVPEKADTTGIGVVLSPSFLEGFTASVDYWDVDITDAIQALAAQTIIDSCYSGAIPALCARITRDSAGLISQIRTQAINLAQQDNRGLDLEASYRMPMSKISSDWRGDFSLHGNMTIYLRDHQDTGFSTPMDVVGQNVTFSGVAAGAPPKWKITATANYTLDPVSVSLIGRAFSNGTFDNRYIVCTTGCPAATVDHPTSNTNSAPGRFYLDANVTYKMDLGERTSADLFFSVKNMFNNDVPPLPGQYYYILGHLVDTYDLAGSVYRAGIRFKM